MIQIDRVVFATSNPVQTDEKIQKEYGLPLAATGQSFPGVATSIYTLPNGGTFEIAYVEDLEEVKSTEQGQVFLDHLEEHGDSYYVVVLETNNLGRIKEILDQEQYPVQVTPVQEVVGPDGKPFSFQMLGSYPHLPWFIQYDRPRQYAPRFPQSIILRTPTFKADVDLLEKLLNAEALRGGSSFMLTAHLPVNNGSVRVESADEYGFSFLLQSGLLFDTMDRYSPKTEE